MNCQSCFSEAATLVGRWGMMICADCVPRYEAAERRREETEEFRAAVIRRLDGLWELINEKGSTF